MKTIENIEAGSLTVVRNGIEPVLAEDLAADCRDFFAKGPGEHRNPKGPDSPSSFYTQRVAGTPDFATMGYEALARVMEITDEPWVQNFGINHQQPWAAQVFHSDLYKRPPVKVIHASSGGAFDFVTGPMSDEEELINHETIELDAGDIVLLHRPALRHRGRNASDQPRYTVARY